MDGVFPWLLIVALLGLSGFFSGSETALFSLSFKQREAAGRRVKRLLDAPREVLLTVLLANLVVNLLFFAFAAKILPASGAFGGVLSGFIALVMILVFGEILPKTLALRAPSAIAQATALPLSFGVFLFSPFRRVVGAIIDLTLRALGESDREDHTVTPEALADVLEKSARDGLLLHGDADLLAEIVELGALRVREIMTPRVKILALDLEADEEERTRTVLEAARLRLPWLPAVRGGADRVIGCVQVRDVLARPDRPLEQLVMPVRFVPEVAPVLSLLREMHEDRISEAIVVDEWGGTAGVVTVEDIFEEIVGELRVEGEQPEHLVVPLESGRFRVSGQLPIRDWNDYFGTRVVPTEFETVGGYVTALLGRLPVAGDEMELVGGIHCVVSEVRGRRVHTLELSVTEEVGA